MRAGNQQRKELEQSYGGVGTLCWRGVAGDEASDRIPTGKAHGARAYKD